MYVSLDDLTSELYSDPDRDHSFLINVSDCTVDYVNTDNISWN